MKSDKKFAVWLITAGLVIIWSFIYAILQSGGSYKYIGEYFLINLGFSGAVLIGFTLIISGISKLL